MEVDGVTLHVKNVRTPKGFLTKGFPGSEWLVARLSEIGDGVFVLPESCTDGQKNRFAVFISNPELLDELVRRIEALEAH